MLTPKAGAKMTARFPGQWLRASVTKTELVAKIEKVPTDIRARIDMSAEVAGAGLCPECRKPMTRSTASGIPILVCMEDRIAIPIADESEEPEKDPTLVTE